MTAAPSGTPARPDDCLDSRPEEEAPSGQLPDWPALMAKEMRVREGVVPATLAGMATTMQGQMMAGEEYFLRGRGFTCYYHKGKGVTYELTDPQARPEMELFLAGSVHAAVAAINGLYPLHASGVVLAGRVVAFTGPSGAGKSTLAAALSRHGLPLFADDTLVLDWQRVPISPDVLGDASGKAPLCLPGHKRLKLWPDAVKLAGVEAQGIVSEHYPKYYARLPASDVQTMLPLGAIIQLTQAETLSFVKLEGGARMMAHDATHHMEQLYQQAQNEDGADIFMRRAALAQSVPHYRFARPFAPGSFPAMLDFLMNELERQAALWR